jgi:hypothetical protein
MYTKNDDLAAGASEQATESANQRHIIRNTPVWQSSGKSKLMDILSCLGPSVRNMSPFLDTAGQTFSSLLCIHIIIE